jgi:hypothetical protein
LIAAAMLLTIAEVVMFPPKTIPRNIIELFVAKHLQAFWPNAGQFKKSRAFISKASISSHGLNKLTHQ